jgi:hypothetical protein
MPRTLVRTILPYVLIIFVLGSGFLMYKPREKSGAPRGLSPQIGHPIIEVPAAGEGDGDAATSPGRGQVAIPIISPSDTLPDSGSNLDVLFAEAQATAERYFRNRIIRCGDSYYFYRTNWLSEGKGEMAITASGAPPERRVITLADSLNGARQSPLLWEGTVTIAMDVLHTAASEKGAIAPTSFQTAWKQHQAFSYPLRKDESGWQMQSDLWEITCADVDRVLTTGRRG